MSWTRRRFLEAVGRAGGAAAAYETMVAMGLLRVPNAFAGRPTLPPDFGRDKKVLILGAGIAGMTAAYELKNAGYTVSILEAKGRPGGRNFTVRRGDVIEEITGSKQLCRFDEGLYLNAGPGRLPYHHTAVLEYCKILGVPLEVYIMSARANLFQNKDGFGGLPMPNRRIANDTRGWIADLLAKSINKGALNKELTGIDKQALLDLLSKFGDVDKTNAYAYIGSSRSGYEIEPGVVGCPEVIEKLQLNDLIKSDFWTHKFYQSEDYEWQPTLFEPVGGMDGIVKGFLGHVGDLIRYNREVTGVHNADGVVRVEHRASGTTYGGEQETADYCISTIPLPILKTITNNNFSDDFKKAIGAVNFASTCKVGWQANRRFWELDDQIYGGISYINHNITQMWYPSHGYFGAKGVLTGTYNYDGEADEMARLELPDRLELAAAGAKLLHPRFDQDVPRELGLSIAWKNIRYQLGGWADDWNCPDSNYNRLLRPDGNVWVAGDQMSHLSGWQEGAIRSAIHVVDRIAKPALIAADVTEPATKLKAMAAPRAKAPSIQRRTRGLP
ncbi:MAG: FAD-dependent oxidoreductase [Acidobacteriota bacterium]